MSVPTTIEVVTLFVDDITQAKAFYEKVFEPDVIYQDKVSCVLNFEGAAVNLLQASEADELVRPAPVARATAARVFCSRSRLRMWMPYAPRSKVLA